QRFEPLGRALVRRADALGSGRARADLLRAAAIAEETLGDLETAVGLHERVREMFGRDAETGDALVRLSERSERTLPLVRILEEEAKVDDTPGRSGALLRRLGDVHAHHTGRLGDAIASYARASELGDEGAPGGLLALVSRLDPDAAGEREPFVTAVS